MKKTARTIIAGTAIAFTIPLLISFAITEASVHALRKLNPDDDPKLLRKAYYAAIIRTAREGSGTVVTVYEALDLIDDEYNRLYNQSLFG